MSGCAGSTRWQAQRRATRGARLRRGWLACAVVLLALLTVVSPTRILATTGHSAAGSAISVAGTVGVAGAIGTAGTAGAAGAGGAGSALARAVLIGHSVRGRPILARVLGADGAARRVLVVGCIHGNECAGLAIVRRLLAAGPAPGVQLWLVGELNPDGSAAGTRQNADGVDLNRNFPFRWSPIAEPIYFSGPHPLSEPESRAAVRLISRIRPAVTIWYHQHEDLVDMAGGDRGIARRYARVAGLRATCLAFLPGTATSWSNHAFPGTTSFVVELPGGALGAAALRRHLRAVRGAELGQRLGSRASCGG